MAAAGGGQREGMATTSKGGLPVYVGVGVVSVRSIPGIDLIFVCVGEEGGGMLSRFRSREF